MDSWHTKQSQPEPLPGIQLVLVDATGFERLLPTELGLLPLYPLDDGFYTVLSPSLGHITSGGDQANEPASAMAEAWSFVAHPDAAETAVHTFATPVMYLAIPGLICSRRNRHSADTMKRYTLPNGLTVRFLDVEIAGHRHPADRPVISWLIHRAIHRMTFVGNLPS
ncbi:hypothetical protein HOY80DRAFT_1040477 [Tuber brumale]|nr:hypothetical protein HOY80DRAFT_1040477 [Tuber brumale]